MAYTKQFTNPHPDGWDDPEYAPPIDVTAMQDITDGLSGIDNYLYLNAGDYQEITPTLDTVITVKANGHSYVVLNIGNHVYSITFRPDQGSSPIVYQGDAPVFEPNSVYELSFLKLNCIWKKR